MRSRSRTSALTLCGRVEGVLLAEEECAVRLGSGNCFRPDAGRPGLDRFGRKVGDDGIAQVEFQLPTAARLAVGEGQLEAAELREPGLELNADGMLGGGARIEALVVEHDRRLQRRQRVKRVRIERHERSRGVARAPVRRVGGKADRPIDEQVERWRGEFERSPFLEALGQDTDEPGGRLRACLLQLEVHAVRITAANAILRAFRQRGEVRGACGDGEAHVCEREMDRAPTLPRFDHREQPLLDGARTQRAAGEQHRIHRPAGEEGREVASDGGIGGVRQADLAQTDPARPGQRVARAAGKESLQHDLPNLDPRHRRVEGRREQTRAVAGNRDTENLARIAVGIERALLQRAGLRHDMTPLAPRQSLVGARLELPLDRVRERKVDVVAAEQEMVARRDALDRRPLALRTDGCDPEQAEVGGAAAHVAHEDRLHRARDVRQDAEQRRALRTRGSLGLLVEPRIKCGLRFFQESDRRRIAGHLRGHARELLCALVEGGGHGDDDALVDERGACIPRERVIPGCLQISEVRGAGLDRRQPELGCNFLRGEGQHLRLAIDAAMGQPRLRRMNHPPRQRRHLLAGERPDHVAGGLVGRFRAERVELALFDLGCGRVVEERRQQRARDDRAQRLELWNRQRLDTRPGLAQRDIRERAVGRAEIDADGKLRRGHRTMAAGDPRSRAITRPRAD